MSERPRLRLDDALTAVKEAQRSARETEREHVDAPTPADASPTVSESESLTSEPTQGTESHAALADDAPLSDNPRELKAQIAHMRERIRDLERQLADSRSESSDLRQAFDTFAATLSNPRVPREKVSQLAQRFAATFAAATTAAPQTPPSATPTTERVARPVDTSTEEYKTFEQFSKDRLISQQGSVVAAQDAYESYAAWCDTNGHDAIMVPRFSQYMEAAGFKKEKIAGRLRFLGAALRE